MCLDHAQGKKHRNATTNKGQKNMMFDSMFIFLRYCYIWWMPFHRNFNLKDDKFQFFVTKGSHRKPFHTNRIL
jgi:hypothetical protein